MQRFILIIILSGLLPVHSSAKEKLVISQWLKTNTIALSYPVGYHTENTAGKPFSDGDLLVFQHISLSEYFPEAGMGHAWPNGQSLRWDVATTDSQGYVILGDTLTPSDPLLVYMAATIRTDRWTESRLEVKSPYLFEAWLNGKKIGTKNSLEQEENTIGKITHTLKLPRGNHLLVIKSLRPPKDGLQWKVMASLEAGDPYMPENFRFGLDHVMEKNILHIMDGVKITGVSPSASGTYYIISTSNSLPPGDQSETWSEVRRFSDGRLMHSFRHARAGRVQWLPKSNAVSYTTTLSGKTTVHRMGMDTGEQEVVMAGVDNFSGMRWSPDESYIIYTLREDGSGEDATMRHVLGMSDRQSQWRNRSFLYSYDISSGSSARLTYGNLSTSLQDISPDAQTLLYSQSWPDYTERPYSRHGLYLLDLSSLESDTIYHGLRWGVSASFSPDGKKLLATGGASAFEGAGENIPEGTIPNNYDRQAYIYDLETRTVTCITKDFDPSVGAAYWHPHSGQVFLSVTDQDFSRIYSYDPQRDRFRMLDAGLDFISGMQLSAFGSVMTFLGNRANAPSRAYRMDPGRQRAEVLHDTESHNYRHVRFGEVRDWNFTSSAGLEITGRYYLPPDFDPEATYPVIVYYYGGTTPVGRSFGGRYPFNLWAGNGYVVYVLQPSGAIGFGQAFSAAHVNNWGITVADEIIEGTKKFLAAHAFTDPDRVGCAGASYGGFMTMLLLTRTDLFAAAISHAGISSISSYWGEGYWGYSYSAEATAESFPWNNPDIYIGQSPLFHADKVTTPLLLLTGDADTNVPPGESIQMFTALKILGRPVELVMVKGENHHIVTYSKRIMWHNAIMGWWDKHLKGQPEWWEEQFPKGNY